MIEISDIYSPVHKIISIAKNIQHIRGTNKHLGLHVKLHQNIKKSIWLPNIGLDISVAFYNVISSLTEVSAPSLGPFNQMRDNTLTRSQLPPSQSSISSFNINRNNR
jgi:hypothetical protein